jgi:hypothetical protein
MTTMLLQVSLPRGDLLKLTWRQGQQAPEAMMLSWGVAVAHGSTAFFSSDYHVYSYSTVPEENWAKLPECKRKYFALAVVNDTLITVGGKDRQGTVTNTLHSLTGSSWEDVLPPMSTKRVHPAAATTPTHLVVAGGLQRQTTVEVLNTDTLQWFTVSSIQSATTYPQLITCAGRFYFADHQSNVLSCSVEDLLNSSAGGSVWTRLASIPTSEWSSLVRARGCVLAIGGKTEANLTSAVHCYDVAANSWSVIGDMREKRSRVLAAALPGELVVVGGWFPGCQVVPGCVTCIGTCWCKLQLQE